MALFRNQVSASTNDVVSILSFVEKYTAPCYEALTEIELLKRMNAAQTSRIKEQEETIKELQTSVDELRSLSKRFKT